MILANCSFWWAALNASGKVYIDVTTLARWKGTLTGIQRCQKIYAMHALDHVQNVCFTLFDPSCFATGISIRFTPSAFSKVRCGQTCLSFRHQSAPGPFCRQVANACYGLHFSGSQRFRRRLIGTLEAIRYRDPQGKAGRWAAHISDRLIKSRERTLPIPIRRDTDRQATVSCTGRITGELRTGRHRDRNAE